MAAPVAVDRVWRAAHSPPRRSCSCALGQEFIPTLDEKNIAMQAMRIPSTALTQSQAMQFEVEKAVCAVSRGRLRLLQDRHGRDRRRSDAAERCPTRSSS